MPRQTAAVLPTPPTTDNLMSVKEAAELAGVAVKTIRRYIELGRLTKYRFGPKLIRVSETEVRSLATVCRTARDAE